MVVARQTNLHDRGLVATLTPDVLVAQGVHDRLDAIDGVGVGGALQPQLEHLLRKG